MADIGALTVAVRLVADDLGSAVAQAQEELSQIADSANQIDGAMDRAGRSIEQSAGKQAAAIAVIAAAAIQGFRMIVGAVNAGTDAYNEYQAAVKGLESVAAHKGVNQSQLGQGLDELTDKFFTAAEASAALKNLLSRGYTLDEAIGTIKRLKDAAAFGRQSKLSLGEAVVTATEGIKNENSVLVNVRNAHLPSHTVRVAA